MEIYVTLGWTEKNINDFIIPYQFHLSISNIIKQCFIFLLILKHDFNKYYFRYENVIFILRPSFWISTLNLWLYSIELFHLGKGRGFIVKFFCEKRSIGISLRTTTLVQHNTVLKHDSYLLLLSVEQDSNFVWLSVNVFIVHFINVLINIIKFYLSLLTPYLFN